MKLFRRLGRTTVVRPVRITAEGEESTVVVVEDSGSGFGPRSLRGDSDPAGLGLLGIRERLEWLGGELHVDSAPGRGTRMMLRAPLRHTPPASATGAAAQGPAAPATPGEAPRRVATRVLLLADDHKVLRQGMASLLASQDDIRIVGQADNGLMAVELARRTRPDVVVMDVSMPEMNGVEATRRVVANLPRTRAIGLSMHEKEDMAQAMREAGAADYLIKDDPAEALLASIRKAAGRGPW